MGTATNMRATYSPVKQRQKVIQGEIEDLEFRSSRNSENLNEIPEEVYLWSCCGLMGPKELNPGLQYMGTFRVLFVLFNLLVFAFGLADLGMGLWFRIDPKVYEIHKYIETQNFTIAGWILLFGGFLACASSLIGLLGMSKQAVSLFVCYLFLIVILTLSFAASIILLTVHGLGSSLERYLVKEVYEQLRRKAMNAESSATSVFEGATQFLDFIQIKMRCCGAQDFSDYSRLGMAVPSSCSAISRNFVNAPGCGRATRLLMDLRAGMAAGFALGSILSQTLAFAVATMIVCSIYHWRTNAPLRSQVRTLELQLQAQQDMGVYSNGPDAVDIDAPVQLRQQRARSRTPIAV